MRFRRLFVCALLVAAISTGLVLWFPWTPADAPLPLPRAVPSLNASTDVAFIGAERCAACHAPEHASYKRTAHSQAMGAVPLNDDPPAGDFFDPLSRKHYAAVRDQGRLFHVESLPGAGQAPESSTDRSKLVELLREEPKYVIGSGHFSRSYLIDHDGFLYESPLTWYASQQAWKLSPGYERSNLGFSRPVEERCLFCHAGRLEAVDRSPHKVRLLTGAIDCERCHGPGALHDEKWSRERRPLPLAHPAAGSGLEDQADLTIVNPARLSRARSEDICAQCHLHSAATVELRGRRLADFRPGQYLADYVAHFAPRQPKREMEVVGHVEQMRRSACYRGSETLTCITCHDPHSTLSDAESRERYRSICLECHQPAACSQPLVERQRHSPTDDCVACHMPKGDTEIPHIAFTHHRIAIHAPASIAAMPGSGSAESPGSDAELIEMDSNTQVPHADQQRNLGLACLQFSDAAEGAIHASRLRGQALDLLTPLEPLNDADVHAALARLAWGSNHLLTLRHARRVLELDAISPLNVSSDALATAEATLGSTLYFQERLLEAAPHLERACQLRPNADLWIMLAEVLFGQGDAAAALLAAEAAFRLAPDRPRYAAVYLRLLEQQGEKEKARQLRQALPAIERYRQQIDLPAQ
jgi:predicted CXXCH cytochrome family protein